MPTTGALCIGWQQYWHRHALAAIVPGTLDLARLRVVLPRARARTSMRHTMLTFACTQALAVTEMIAPAVNPF